MPVRTPEEYLKEPYARVLIPDEGGQFAAEILEFPGCVTFGNSPDETFNKLEETAKAWIEVELEQGHEIPPASANYDHSGRFVLRLPKSMHRQAAVYAEREGVSLNQFLLSAIAARIGAEDLFGRMAERAENRPVVMLTQHNTISFTGRMDWQSEQVLSGASYPIPALMMGGTRQLISSGRPHSRA